MKLLMVGRRGGTNVGACFERAVGSLPVATRMMESSLAMEAPVFLKQFNWWVRGRYPTHLRSFGRRVVKQCEQWKPEVLLSTGIAPINRSALQEIGSLGIRRLNYLTDDPWNPAHRSAWFLNALPLYDHVFSTKSANLEDLRRQGVREVSYLPFAYAPEKHFPEPPTTLEEKSRFSSDILFFGGADQDRIPYMAAIIQADFHLALYGGYWKRFRATRAHAKGQADFSTLRKAVSGAKVNLCLVRRANRDGNSMRTFEIPAMGGCMLLEDTREHRELFGDEAKAVVYFRTLGEMIEKLRDLLGDDEKRRRLAEASHQLITQGKHAYIDRLQTMLSC